MDYFKKTWEATKATMLNLPEVEVKVRLATNNDPWGPSTTQMRELAHQSNSFHDFPIIMNTIWLRMNDDGKNWRHIYKAMTLLDFLVKNGSEQVVREARVHMIEIQTLTQFQHIDENDKDVGASVREKAKQLSELLHDDHRIREERDKARRMAHKFREAISSDGRAFGSGWSGGGGGGNEYGGGGGGGYGGYGSGSGGYGGEASYGSSSYGASGYGDDRYGSGGGSHTADRYAADPPPRLAPPAAASATSVARSQGQGGGDAFSSVGTKSAGALSRPRAPSGDTPAPVPAAAPTPDLLDLGGNAGKNDASGFELFQNVGQQQGSTGQAGMGQMGMGQMGMSASMGGMGGMGGMG
eukprot:CAMPEP_0177673378 /NCGR_PEP_ID=MMETSP0447-20121125/25909_1 /TAXON_ID=0 /ORGANISM="Stygamoeba regulata, Strain BSH-02190019" /LENGTH=353 /DNA_ID=CAMNT_0019181241 /DNA_START=186 /DNA_END=1244 /DNA_ORIENTATION=+